MTLCGCNGPSRGSILSHRRFEEPTPGWFSHPSGQGGFQPMTSSLYDHSRSVLVPVSAFCCSSCWARLYHASGIWQGNSPADVYASGGRWLPMARWCHFKARFARVCACNLPSCVARHRGITRRQGDKRRLTERGGGNRHSRQPAGSLCRASSIAAT